MAETAESKALTLAQVCAIGQSVLDECQALTVRAEERRGEPVHEAHAADVISESVVRAVTKRVLGRLAALPQGTRASLPQTLVIGGVKQQLVYKGNIALSFRLQFDGSRLHTVLHVGGYIIADEQATHHRRGA
jgi:hypothetical protein